MAIERTFSIIKPDATRRNLTGKIAAMLEEAGLRIIASKRVRLTKEQAEGFYAVHRERPFYNDLVQFMTSGPVVVQVLEGENSRPEMCSRIGRSVLRSLPGDLPKGQLVNITFAYGTNARLNVEAEIPGTDHDRDQRIGRRHRREP